MKDGGAAVTTNYCYDALHRLVAAKVTTTCGSSPTEAYTYDGAGNRTKTVISGVTTWFGHNAAGQLCKTGASSGTDCTGANVTYDATGRTLTWNGWTFIYDGDGRLATACKVAGCVTGDKVSMRYDGEGRRVELVVRPNGGSATTTTFRYQGETVAQELTDTGSGSIVTREYVGDEQGAIVKICDPNCASPTKTYLVTYNGHGDALATWQVNGDGTLTLANSYTYDTWGKPTVRDGSGTVLTWSDTGNIRFRFLYVGAHDVQWDDLGVGLGLAYMHARHYSPVLGRFVQPDPAALDANLYAYSGSNPVTNADPTGTCWSCRYQRLQQAFRYAHPYLRYYTKVTVLLNSHRYVVYRVPRWQKYSRSAITYNVERAGCDTGQWGLGLVGLFVSGAGLVTSTVSLLAAPPTAGGSLVVTAIGWNLSLASFAFSTAQVIDCASR